jgi:hypothetical protein
MRRLAICAAALALAASAFTAAAQTCPRGQKFAAGACVTSCPGGYEDRGRTCVYRSQGTGGGQ